MENTIHGSIVVGEGSRSQLRREHLENRWIQRSEEATAWLRCQALGSEGPAVKWGVNSDSCSTWVNKWESKDQSARKENTGSRQSPQITPTERLLISSWFEIGVSRLLSHFILLTPLWDKKGRDPYPLVWQQKEREREVQWVSSFSLVD